MKKKFLFCFLLVIFILLISCREPAGTAVPRLINDLKSTDSHVRNKAALKLGNYGKEAKTAVPYLIKLLSDVNGGVRTSAAFALRSIDDPKGIQALDAYEK